MTLGDLKDEADRLRLYLDDQGVALDERRRWIPRFEWLLDEMSKRIEHDLAAARTFAQVGWPVASELLAPVNPVGARRTAHSYREVAAPR